jgi:hypothetical protein
MTPYNRPDVILVGLPFSGAAGPRCWSRNAILIGEQPTCLTLKLGSLCSGTMDGVGMMDGLTQYTAC